jgi:hypothetical protein
MSRATEYLKSKGLLNENLRDEVLDMVGDVSDKILLKNGYSKKDWRKHIIYTKTEKGITRQIDICGSKNFAGVDPEEYQDIMMFLYVQQEGDKKDIQHNENLYYNIIINDINRSNVNTSIRDKFERSLKKLESVKTNVVLARNIRDFNKLEQDLKKRGVI